MSKTPHRSGKSNPLWDAYVVGRLINSCDWLAPQVTVGLKPFHKIQNQLDQIATLAGSFMPPQTCDELRALVEKVMPDWEELSRQEHFFEGVFSIEHNCDPIRDILDYAALVQQCYHAPIELIKGFEPEGIVGRTVKLGIYVDTAVHPVPAFHFNQTLPGPSLPVNFPPYITSALRDKPPPLPLFERARPYLRPSPSMLDAQRLQALCQEAGLILHIKAVSTRCTVAESRMTRLTKVQAAIKTAMKNITPPIVAKTTDVKAAAPVPPANVAKKARKGNRRRGRTRKPVTPEHKHWIKVYESKKSDGGRVSLKALATCLKVDYAILREVIKRHNEQERVKAKNMSSNK